MNADRITLSVPARGEYAKTVRLTAAQLVSRMDWSYDDVDDVRIAAEEAFIYAVETLSDDAEVTITFLVDEQNLEMHVALGSEGDAHSSRAEAHTEYAAFILESVCDTHELVSSDEGQRSLRLHMRAGSADDA